MKIDKNKLKSLISISKPQDLLILSVDSLDKNSYKNYQIEIDKFIKKDQDYIITVIKRQENFEYLYY